MPRINDVGQYPIVNDYEGSFFLGSENGTNRTVNFDFKDFVEYVRTSTSNDISLLSFTVDDDMNLIMEVETSSVFNFNFVLDNNGYLTVTINNL